MSIVSLALGLSLMLNGIFMLYAPAAWYEFVPGISDTGALNVHFVRDIGCAFAVAGAALCCFSVDRRARAAVIASAAFLTLHALVHVAEAVGGRVHNGHLPSELLTVFAPAAVALCLGFWPIPATWRPSMLKWLIERRIAAFERTYGYDSSYARRILEADTGAFLRFARVMGLAQYRKSVPAAAAWCAAKITAALAEDCGPCTQLAVTMAERDGLLPATLTAIVTGDERVLPDDARLGVRFARAVMAHDPGADDLRADIVRRWGERGLVSLSFAVAAARIFPTLKYALGHGQACRRVMIGGAAISPLKQAA
jgi:uncharacterized protein YjeT (DUF2065 family)